MAERIYRVEWMLDRNAAEIEKRLNERYEEGWELAHITTMLHQVSEEVWTVLVFKRREELVIGEPWAHAIREAPVGDNILLREMRAANDDARPVKDPLLDGGLRR